MKRIEGLCRLLHVTLDIKIEQEAKTYVVDYINKCNQEKKIPRIIFSIDNHLEHLDLIISYYMILLIAQEVPQLYPHILTVTAKDVWENQLMKWIVQYYVNQIHLFDRDKAKIKASLQELIQLVGDEQDVFIGNMSNQPGRGQDHNAAPVYIVCKASDDGGIIIVINSKNISPTLPKRESKFPEFFIIAYQVILALQRKENVIFSASIGEKGILKVNGPSGRKRDIETNFLDSIKPVTEEVSTPEP